MQNFKSFSLTTLVIFLINWNVTGQMIKILKTLYNVITIMLKTKPVHHIKVY